MQKVAVIPEPTAAVPKAKSTNVFDFLNEIVANGDYGPQSVNGVTVLMPKPIGGGS